jgi:hypothetical protein
MKNTKLVTSSGNETVPVSQSDFSILFERCLNSVRPDLRDNPYILEGLRVLSVQGYRSAIGSFWNAVIDDLRNKVMARSLKLFNKSVALQKEIKRYEDFQDYVNDDQLIEGAYAIGVIGWEASRVLKHAKETRHIFDGHPKSSEPSVIKVLAMMDDCVRYVLNADYPPPIIDIDEYINMLGTQQFDRNIVAVENALGSLPEIYKAELANRLFTSYVHFGSTTILRSNIEFVIPTLWQVLPKETKVLIVHRVDQEIPKGDIALTEQAFSFVRTVSATAYLSPFARKYKIIPLVKELKENLDKWKEENRLIGELLPYASLIPHEVLSDYVHALVHTYVGHIGFSSQYSRSDFYANEASNQIPIMMQAFDDRSVEAFVECIKNSDILRIRIQNPAKMRRLRALGNIALERASKGFSDRHILEALVNEKEEESFIKMLPALKK